MGEIALFHHKLPVPDMKIDRLDHLVLTVADIGVTCDFYARVLGLRTISYGEGRRALLVGEQKINLHQRGGELEPKAAHPTPGSADLCFITATDLDAALAHIRSQDVAIVEGPVLRTGALGPIRSVYFRDPDMNLIEVSVYIDPQP